MALTEDLVALLGEDAVVRDPSDFARFEAGWRYGRGRAGAVVRPSTTEAVARFMAFCSGRGLRVLPQGANTGLVGASVPDASGGMAVLSLERLNRRLEIDPLDRTALVDAGVLLSTLNGALAAHGLQFPVDLGADPQLGGMVATNTGGTRLLRYGDVRRNLLGLEVVLADGTVVDGLSSLRKTNTGLDWKQLFTGTSGLFGVVTAAVVQAVPLPRQRAAALVALADGDAALRLLRTLERELGDLLTAFEVMSAAALEPVFRHQERLRNPFDALPPYTALVEASTVLGEGRLALGPLLEETLGVHLEEDGDGVLDARFGRPEDFWALRHHVSESLRQEGRVLAFDIAVPRPRLPAFTRAVEAWLRETFPWVRVCDFGHWGDGGTHLNLVWTESEADLSAEDLVDRLQERIYRMAVVEFQGSYSAEHGVGPHNQRFFEAFAPAPVKAAGAALRAHFDPGGLLGTARLW